MDLFARGVAAYEDEEYETAAETFRRYADRVPGDAAGWYNLGTAYHRTGQAGQSVQAWLNGLRLDPRDRDTRHNLRIAGTPPELVQRVTPLLPLRQSEMLVLAALAWLLTGIAGAVWVVRRGRVSAVTALVGLAVVLSVAGVWWDSTRRSGTLIVLDATTLRAGPTLRAEPLSALEPGDGLIPVDTYGEWARVRTVQGQEGWIESNTTGRLR